MPTLSPSSRPPSSLSPSSLPHPPLGVLPAEPAAGGPPAATTGQPLADRLRQHAQARAEAEALRRAALDDAWRGAQHLLATANTRALRAANRLRHRLQRHPCPAVAR